MQEESQDYMQGTVSAVIYQNEENGYTVLRLDVGDGALVTVVGCMPGVAPGESISVQGSWTRHASYGEQFKAETVERRLPAGAKAIFDYLSSGAVRGIGAATARRMIEEFGEDALTVLEEHPEQLTRIKGITRKKALTIGEHFRLQMGMRRLLAFLGEHEVPLQLAMPLYRRYGDRALEVIRGNPYLMVDEELGVDFSTADALALSMGMEGDDPQRIEAALLFELTYNLDNGHAFLPRRKLLLATGQLIGVEGESLEDALETLLERGEVIQEPVAGEEAVYLQALCEAEQYVAWRLTEMSRGELVAPHGLKNRLLDLMDGEIEKARQGKPARIFVKVNSVTDRELIDKLAQASQAGVPVTMNVRGICCLRPGVPGLTDHIKVFSIVGRYLEHPRIYAFGVGEETRIYIGSADLMTRNTERRVEIACPVLDPAVRRQIRHYVELYCSDNEKARVLQPDGSYTRVERPEGAPGIDAQAALMDEAEREALAAAQAPPAPERRSGLLSRLFGRRKE